MKLRHLTCIAHPSAWPGITRRLAEQARVAKAAGLDMRFTVLTCEPCTITGVECVVMDPWERFSRCRAILRRGLLDGFDATVLRYPTSLDLAISPLLDRHGRYMVSEHHTDEVAELRLVGTALGGRVRSFIEKRRKRSFLSRLAGLIAVTEELRKLELTSAPTLPSIVIGNGIDTSTQSAHGPSPFDDGRLRIVWACSEFAPWQGLDRLLMALSSRRGGPVVELALAGRLTAEQDGLIDRTSNSWLRIHRHGLVNQTTLDQLLRTTHLVVGTLALHRKHMREACPLKVREAIARGLPVITSCLDPDLPATLSGILHLPGNEVPLDGDFLVERSLAIARNPTIPALLRKHAVSVMDWRPKLHHMVAFVAKTTRR